jgi:hypothetical protein
MKAKRVGGWREEKRSSQSCEWGQGVPTVVGDEGSVVVACNDVVVPGPTLRLLRAASSPPNAQSRSKPASL